LALAIFLPQKLAGPLYRVQKSLEEIRSGDLTAKVILRKGDTLTDLAAAVNETTTGLRDRVQEVKEIQAELDQIIASLEHQEATAVSARQKVALDRLRT
jgi:methyl-accepting chemotaxis protein